MSERFVRYLFENYYDTQEPRKATFNRIVAYVKANSAKFREFLGPEPKKYAKAYAKVANMIAKGKIRIAEEDRALRDTVWYYGMLCETEKGLKKRLGRWSETHPIRVEYLNKIYGIGPILSSGIIAWLAPIILSEKCDTVSKAWAYCGLSAIHWESECTKGHKMITTSAVAVCPVKVKKKGGKKEERVPCGAEIIKSLLVNSPPKRKTGYVLMINSRLKTFCWKIAWCFEKQQARLSQYRRFYVEKKAKYLNRPELREPIEAGVPGAKLHVQLMSLRRTVKEFIKHLWYVWRKMEGLPVTKPYSDRIPGHEWEEPKTDEEINEETARHKEEEGR